MIASGGGVQLVDRFKAWEADVALGAMALAPGNGKAHGKEPHVPGTGDVLQPLM